MTSISIELCFCVAWAGSNKQIASSLLFCHNQDAVLISANALQRQVANLVNAEPWCIKILLGSPAGPQITPVLRVYSGKTFIRHRDTQSFKNMVAAWSSLEVNTIIKVFVTQHSPAALGVHELQKAYSTHRTSVQETYHRFPESLRCNPAVALVALDILAFSCYLPDDLVKNKAFALVAMRCVKQPITILGSFDQILRGDEDVVLAAVARNALELWYASPQLRASKSFVLKAVGVNGECIAHVAPELRRNKEVALAAVHQTTKAVDYLSKQLQQDKDIQQACTNNR